VQISRILKYPHPVLRHNSKPLTKVDRELKQMIAQMLDMMQILHRQNMETLDKIIALKTMQQNEVKNETPISTPTD
jgi:peptide deformylase